MNAMTIRYSKVLPILLIVVGVPTLVLALLSLTWLQIFTGVVLSILGVLMLVNPIVRIEPNEVQVRNPLGMTLKRLPLSSPADLQIDGKVLRHRPSGKKVSSLGFGIDKADVARLRTQLAGEPM